MDYEDFEAKYNELLSDYNREKQQLQDLKSEKQIQLELERIDSMINNCSAADTPTESSDISPNYEAQIQQLMEKIKTEESSIEEKRNKNLQSIKQIEDKIVVKKQQLSQIESKTYPQLDELSAKNQKLAEEQATVDGEMNRLEKERQRLESELNKSTEQYDFLISQNKNNESEKNSLSETVARLRKQEEESKNKIIQLEEQLQKSEQQLTQNQQTCENDQQLQDLTAKIATINQAIAKLAQQFDRLTKQAHEADKNNLIEKENKLKKALDSNRAKEEKIRKNIQSIKEEKEKILEEKKKKKSKPTTDFHLQSIRLKKENQMLEAERERLLRKLKELAEVRKTYVKQQQLLAVKEELDKYRNANRPIQASRANYQKLEDTYKHLSKSIEILKKNERKLIAQKQNHLNQTKEKAKELLESKTFYERNISHCQNKLNDYMREFPNHEKNKLDLKQREKEMRAEEKRRKKEAEEAERKRKAAQQEAQKEEDQIPNFVLPVETDSSTPIYMNQTVQYGALGATVVIAVAGYYLSL